MQYKKYLKISAIIVTIYIAIIVIIGLSASPKDSDVAVVLGNEVYADGTPSKRLQERLNAAIDLYKNRKVKQIIASGGVGKSGYNEAAIMTKYLQTNGVNPQDIITDLTGINTMATAINTAKIASGHNFKTIVIVSQYYHLPRCELAFRQAGITNFSADYPLYFEIYDIYSIIREAVAIPFYIIYGVER